MLNFVKKKRGENVVRFLEGNWGKLYNWNGAESKGYKISNFEKKINGRCYIVDKAENFVG
jgi:hypothetical protein